MSKANKRPPPRKPPARRKARPDAARQGQPLLLRVGARVRTLREARDQSRRALALQSGISERFLADLESGAGNISLARLAALCDALGTSAGALLREAEEAAEPAPRKGPRAELLGSLGQLTAVEERELLSWVRARFGRAHPKRPLVALLGLRGAGKSTIGRALAGRLGFRFIELDARVEEAAGLSLADIFALHGEEYYRRLARELLVQLLGEQESAPVGAVIATGGSIVTDPQALKLLTGRCRTVWLKATPEDHWRRVLAQGDERPSSSGANAQAELRALLQARAPLYARAELSVDTSRLGIGGAVDAVVRAL